MEWTPIKTARRPARWVRVATIAGAVTAGPVIAGAAVLALRRIELPAGEVLSASFFVSELAYGPCFLLSLAFAVSWSLIGLRVRDPRSGGRRDHWTYPPLLVWALLFVRELTFYFEGSGHWSGSQWTELFLVAAGTGSVSLGATLFAMLPTLLQDARRSGIVGLELAALLPVAVVFVDWALLSSTVSIFWLRQLEAGVAP